MKWISIEQDKPRAHRDVLFYVDGKMTEGYRSIWRRKDKYTYVDVQLACLDPKLCPCFEAQIPTHWMPLPSKPNGVEGKK